MDTEHARERGPRLDIQGLRTIAVGLVIVDHLFEWPSGGFIGVDVFFVISGFLITGQLLAQTARDGQVSFSHFYRRRIKRIFPAATLVLVAGVAAAYVVYPAARFATAVADAGWAFIFLANWRFAAQGTDYFQIDAPPSIFQHYWSLAVEEQFYAVWPVVMFVIVLTSPQVARHTRRARHINTVAIAAIIVASFAWALVQSSSSPTWAYFSSLTRMWELGIGALLAINIAMFDRLPDRLRPLLAWAGLLTIGASAFVITETSGFPAPAGLLPVLATALIIGVGARGGGKHLWPLTSRPSVYVGDISYSLYLWHWPVIVIAEEQMGRGRYFYATALCLMFAAAIAAYHFVEDPIRRSNWLVQTRPDPAKDRARRATRRYAGVGCALLVAAGLAVVVLQPTSEVRPPTRQPISERGATLAASDAREPRDELADMIEESVGVTAWPDTLDPSIDDLPEAPLVGPAGTGCGSYPRPALDECAYGDASADKLVMLVGDSIAMTLVEPLNGFVDAQDGGWRARYTALNGCPFADMKPSKYLGADQAQDCLQHRAETLAEIEQLNPDVLLIANNYGTGDNGVPADAQSAIVEAVADDVGEVVLMSPPPVGEDLNSCYAGRSAPPDCITPLSDTWLSRAQGDTAAAAAVDGTFVDTRLWYCTWDGLCPAFVGDTIVKRDTTHMTLAYQDLILPEFIDALAEAGS